MNTKQSPSLTSKNSLWDETIRIIESCQRFILVSHRDPDCDALGSCLALAYHLDQFDKTVTILNHDPVPEAYQFLDPERRIEAYDAFQHNPIIDQAEVIIILDASSGWSRSGQAGQALAQTQTQKTNQKRKVHTICIDHHVNATPFADIMVVNPEVIATAELIYDLIMAMQGQLSFLMAQALYAALMTDSGSFRFPKTSPQSHRIAAHLLEAGAENHKIYRLIYEQLSWAYLRTKGYVLQNIQLAYEGQVAYVGLDLKTLRGFGLDLAELTGLSGAGLDIKGVRMAILAVEVPENKIKLSLRSDGSVIVNEIAAAFSGGGHQAAAGATTEGDLHEILDLVLKKVADYL